MKAKVESAAVLAAFVVCVGVTSAKPHTHHPRKKMLVSTPTPTATPSPSPTPTPTKTPAKIHTPDDIAALHDIGELRELPSTRHLWGEPVRRMLSADISPRAFLGHPSASIFPSESQAW